MIITFKRYPELGRLKVVKDSVGNGCVKCALFTKGPACILLQKRSDNGRLACSHGFHHYEPAPPRKGERT